MKLSVAFDAQMRHKQRMAHSSLGPALSGPMWELEDPSSGTDSGVWSGRRRAA